ncbi:MAG TPA: acylneuraminate cytidylyltransferase family protein [Gemmatimonadaceae bacterium]|nr:acylneuraminate cytidylyltransferase family protein [Gemmatimonadaceae bacterium]
MSVGLTSVALIPARSGSRRVPGKNIRPLAGHPLIAYTIAAALESGVFDAVVVSTDSQHYAEIARHYGAEVTGLRPSSIAGEVSPDIEWVDYHLRELQKVGREFDAFSILRPTNPFRLGSTIRRAWEQFVAEKGVDSLRAVELCGQHPGKMWVVRGNRMVPLLPQSPGEQPWHSTPYQALPQVYVQNASLEIAWTRVVFGGRTIAGDVVMPFFTSGDEGLDVNSQYDWRFAEEVAASRPDALPAVHVAPFPRDMNVEVNV